MSDHDDIAELLGAYALHAVDPDERALIDAHLERCPRCRAEVRDHELVAALIGNTGGNAPDGLWDRIAGTLEEAAPPMRLDLARRRRAIPRVAVGLAAAAAVLIAVLGVQVVRQDHRIGTLQEALGSEAMLRAANLALTDPGAEQARLTSPDGTLRAAAVVLPDGTGYLMAQDMPTLGQDRTYQLWGQTSGGLISLGLLGVDPNDVVAFQAGDAVGALAITEEQASGVVASRNSPVLSGRLD